MNFKRYIPLLLALCLCVGLCACGGSDSKEPAAPSGSAQPETAGSDSPSSEAPGSTEATAPAQGETLSWGDWTIDVPAGFTLEGGDIFDETDLRYFSVKKSDFVYFDFTADGEELITKHYEYNKNTYTNEQKDVQASFGGSEWTGFQYSDGFGGYGFEAYTTVDGEMIRVSAAGFAFDDALVSALLGSLQHTPAEPAEPDSPEPIETEEEPNEGAPVYAKIIELEDVTLGIKEGYTEKKDATPAQYVMVNDETGGMVSILNVPGTAEDKIADAMAGTAYSSVEEDLNGMRWMRAENDNDLCILVTEFGENVLLISIDYGATEQEIEDLIFGVTPKGEG